MTKLLNLSAKRVSVTHNCYCCMATINNPCLFFLVPSHLYIFRLCPSRYGETEKGPLRSVPKDWESGCSYAFVVLSSWEVPCCHWAAWGWHDVDTMTLSSFSSCAVLLTSCSAVLLKFKWTPDLSQSCFG